MPKSLGGSDDIENLALACRRCNERHYNFTNGIDYALEALNKSQLMILHHSQIAETRWLKTQPSLQQVVVNS
ncbi:MAG: HNH endonuclease [Microcoleus sp.]